MGASHIIHWLQSSFAVFSLFFCKKKKEEERRRKKKTKGEKAHKKTVNVVKGFLPAFRCYSYVC